MRTAKSSAGLILGIIWPPFKIIIVEGLFSLQERGPKAFEHSCTTHFKIFYCYWVLTSFPLKLGRWKKNTDRSIDNNRARVLEYEISQIIAKICHFLSGLDFPTMTFQLFCVVWAILMLKSNVIIQYIYTVAIVIFTMWLVGSKPIRSNVTIPTTSFSCIISCHHKVVTIYLMPRSLLLHNRHHVLCVTTSSSLP